MHLRNSTPVLQALLTFSCLTVALLALLTIAAWAFHKRPRAWSPNEVPIAFWSWRTETPASADVQRAVTELGARSLFLRAGQIAYGAGSPYRARSVFGPFPTNIELHVVYNATPALLQQLEQIDEQTLANAITRSYYEDAKRASDQNAKLVGVQLDIDVPTRLLSYYARLLTLVRADLPKGTLLSITGLPTWMDSSDLNQVVDIVDFWIPQFYGAQIPERSTDIIPISSPQQIERAVRNAAAFGKAFYAGVAAYGHALLYNASGSLIGVHGNIDPAIVAADPNMMLIGSGSFSTVSTASAEYRYVFRVSADGVTDQLATHAGDLLVLDVPTVESLRVAARIVRQHSGDRLLGICVFRLPVQDDPSTLTVGEVKAALADREPEAVIDVRITRGGSQRLSQQRWTVEIENTGTVTTPIDKLTIDVPIPAGSLQTLTSRQDLPAEPLCATTQKQETSTHPCTERRANLIRFRPRYLPPGRSLSALLTTVEELPPTTSVTIYRETEAGCSYSNRETLDVSIGSGKENGLETNSGRIQETTIESKQRRSRVGVFMSRVGLQRQENGYHSN